MIEIESTSGLAAKVKSKPQAAYSEGEPTEQGICINDRGDGPKEAGAGVLTVPAEYEEPRDRTLRDQRNSEDRSLNGAMCERRDKHNSIRLAGERQL